MHLAGIFILKRKYRLMKIAVAMSGGVDSSVTAALLKNQGHHIVGITARFFNLPDFDNTLYSKSLEDAKKICSNLDIEHHFYDLSGKFTEEIIDPFCDSYLSGTTPNPCINCNRKIKFKKLMDIAESLGCDKLATGHYARIKEIDGRYTISISPENGKDQSYFLFMLSQEQLSNSIFPLGEFTKEEVRQMAADYKLDVKDKSDSQEICFIPDNRYPEFIEKWTGKIPEPGRITDSSGRILGDHKGIHRYTIGQRRGMGISAPVPLYVVKIDSKNNNIIAGPEEELYSSSLYTVDAFHMKKIITEKTKAWIKTRSTQIPVPGTVYPEDNHFHVEFDEPQRGITAGQGAVFYDDDMNIIGGGIIK
jgi:tRNA-specific 2-thiouridylase